jgi:hypothetical protein
MSTQPSKNDRWEAFQSKLSIGAATVLKHVDPLRPVPQLELPGDDLTDFSLWSRDLISPLSLDVMLPTRADDADPEDVPVYRYCLCESEDGEAMVVRLFRDHESLVRRMGSQEGQDMYLAAFWGIPLQFTKGPQRFLMHPDGSNAIPIPVVEGAAIEFVSIEQVLEKQELQDDGYVGPIELTIGVDPSQQVIAKASVKKGLPAPETDDDEDD